MLCFLIDVLFPTAFASKGQKTLYMSNFSAVNTCTHALLTCLVYHCFVQVYATGYGHGGRLGLGGTETVTSVRLIESLQHVVIKKVAVHSGGKHAMALSMDGDVYSWGEGEDGKLGHGSRG